MILMEAVPFQSLVIVVLVAVVMIAAQVIVIAKLVHVCPPNEVLVLSGRRTVLEDGSVIGYRIVRGGRAVSLPFLETVGRLSLASISVQLTINNLRFSDGKPMPMVLAAVVRIDSELPGLRNAIERFLGTGRDSIEAACRDLLEGAARATAVQFSAAEVSLDRKRFEQTMLQASADEFGKMGLVIDALRVQRFAQEVITFRS